MKTKIYLACLISILMIFACQKEALIDDQKIIPNSPEQQQLAEIKQWLPENVELTSIETRENFENSAVSYSNKTINLTDCKGKQCYQVIPNYLNQMQLTANKFCQSMKVAVCCCTKGSEWCYQFTITPQFTCGATKAESKLIPESKYFENPIEYLKL